MVDDTERLIVQLEGRIDAFEKAMVAAERRGTMTYQSLQKNAFKATTAIEKQMLASAKAQGRALDSVFGQTVERANKSAKESAAFFREIERGRDSINQLRASYDPLFASSMRYEQALEEINEAARTGIITEREQAQMLDQVAVAYLSAGQAAGAHSGQMGMLGNVSAETSARLQNAGFQVQDVAVQIMGGTDAARALSMQLPQLLSGFGLLGVAAGVLASVGLPLLTAMFGEGEGAAKTFGDAMGAVENSISAMNEQAAIYSAEGLVALKEKYGEVNAELMEFISAQTEIARVDALNNTRDAMAAMADETETWNGNLKVGLANLFEMEDTLYGQAKATNLIAIAMERAQNATNFEDQLSAISEVRQRILEVTGGVDNMTREQYKFYRMVAQSEDALRQLVVTVPKQGWLAAAIGQAETLAGKLWEAVRAKAAVTETGANMTTGTADWTKNSLGFTLPGEELIGLPAASSGDGSGGVGGGSGGGRGSSKIDALLADLQTEREVIAAWHEESLLTLNSATEAELAVIGGRHEALERLEAEHQERLRAIKGEGQGTQLADVGEFFGGMAALTKAGGDRMLKVHRATAAAQGIINSYTAFTEVLKDPSFIGRPWARIGAAAAALSSGLSAVASIKSGGGGSVSGGSGGGGSASGGKVQEDRGSGPLRVSMDALDPNAIFTGATVRKLLDGLIEEAGNRGIIFTGQS